MKSGFKIVDAFNARGRKNIKEKLPRLIEDIKDIVDSQAQTDPSFKTTRLFTRITVKEVRNQLIKQKNYEDKDLPTNQTLNNVTVIQTLMNRIENVVLKTILIHKLECNKNYKVRYRRKFKKRYLPG